MTKSIEVTKQIINMMLTQTDIIPNDLIELKDKSKKGFNNVIVNNFAVVEYDDNFSIQTITK